jgi:S-formylglutathione hydrolase FrmB
MKPRALAAAVLAAAGCCAAAAAPAAAGPPRLRLTVSRTLDGRLRQLTFRTPIVAGPTHVRILLPTGYARSKRRYPVLYLLHGAADDYRSWTDKGAAERLTAGLRLIVVMPDTGPTGGYTDWYNGGAGGPPEWETYHIDELLPWVDRHFRTTPRRSERAVAGLSMGGFGAMSYAARHPDLFGAAASFSGAVDTNNPLDIAVTGDDVFGPRATQEVRWRAHDPWDLAANLRGLDLVLRTGNGLPGGPFGGGDIVEETVHAMSVAFHRRLQRLHIPHLWDDYGPGGHTWPYWQRDLRATLPRLMAAFAHPRPAPSPFSFTAVEPHYRVFGWSVRLVRRALQWSTLHRAGVHGFCLTGSGRATVVTGRLYRPRSLHVVRVRGAAGARRLRRRADRHGRLRVTVDLGQSNRFPEFTAAARAGGERFRTARVGIGTGPRRG